MTVPADLELVTTAWRRRPVLLGLVLTTVLVALILRVGPVPVLPAYLVAGVVGVSLAAVDVATLRLPDAIVLPFSLAALVLLAAAAAVDGEPGPLVRAVLGAVVAFVVYLVLALLSPSGLGFGDVKLAGVLGLYLGRLGWDALVVGVVAGFVLVALAGLVLIVLRRATRTTALPFGPFMLAGALLGIVAGEPVAAAYFAG